MSNVVYVIEITYRSPDGQDDRFENALAKIFGDDYRSYRNRAGTCDLHWMRRSVPRSSIPRADIQRVARRCGVELIRYYTDTYRPVATPVRA